MGQIRLALKILLGSIIGFILFLLVLGVLNFLLGFIDNAIYRDFVFFLNSNLGLIVLFTLFLTVGEIFSVLIFPLNIPYPLLSAIGSIFLIRFLFNILLFVFEILNINVVAPFNTIYYFVAVIVFLIVLVVGYLNIFRRARKRSYFSDERDVPIRKKRFRRVKRRL